MNLNLMTDRDATQVAQAVKTSPKSPGELAADARNAPDGKTPQVAADDAYSKLLKLVPIPILAPYLTMENLFRASVDDSKPVKLLVLEGSARQWVCWATLVLFTVLVPLYLARSGVVRTGQLVVTTIGFLVLTTATPGPWQLAHWWHDYFATAALILAGVGLVFYFQKLPDLKEQAVADIASVAHG